MSSGIECPLCGEAANDRSGLRVHLMVKHRKSDLASLVVDREERGEPITA